MNADYLPFNEEFDEQYYLAQNSDVATTIGPDGWASGLEHFLKHGKSEGRLGAPNRLHQRVLDSEAIRDEARLHRGAGFLSPNTLKVTSLTPVRIALIGSCMMRSWNLESVSSEIERVDLHVVNFLSVLPEISAEESAQYDFAVIQVPLRSVLPDSAFSHLSFDDPAAFVKTFDDCCGKLLSQLTNWMAWNRHHGLLTFVCNFLVPQANLMGRLFPRYDLRNPQYFIEQLNEQLERIVRSCKNSYLFDIDRISSSIGRRYVQDDSYSHTGHNAMLAYGGVMAERIEPTAALPEYYEPRWVEEFRPAVWAELSSMFRTVRQIDAIKLVVFDLDDTLWNGISGDLEEIDSSTMIEGWPLGVAEAAAYLKKRGILLAIISKNEEQRVRHVFPQIWGDRLLIDDFAAIRINWCPKSENMAELLNSMSLLPRNVLFVDDNPAERSAMQAAFPEMRIIGKHPYYLRRILLWSSEIEVVTVTNESGRRTEMMQRQFEREYQKKLLSREDFLLDAAPKVEILEITDMSHARFPRVIELINKTNQFNTTGKRWKIEEFGLLLLEGGRIFSFSVSDKFTDYGLVGVVLIEDVKILQWVMSCRVLGYDIEKAVMAKLVSLIRSGGAMPITADLVETDVNFPCRSLFSVCRFEKSDDAWVLPDVVWPECPAHISISVN